MPPGPRAGDPQANPPAGSAPSWQKDMGAPRFTLFAVVLIALACAGVSVQPGHLPSAGFGEAKNGGGRARLDGGARGGLLATVARVAEAVGDE
jgi:hypothetical protein